MFLFVHQAEGISRLPPDSHCCNWVVGTNTTVPAKALGNLHATKALFYSTFHMMSEAQMWQTTKCNQSGMGGEIIVCPRRERERKSFHQAKQVCAREAWVTESAAHGQGSQSCCFQISFYLFLSFHSLTVAIISLGHFLGQGRGDWRFWGKPKFVVAFGSGWFVFLHSRLWALFLFMSHATFLLWSQG